MSIDRRIRDSLRRSSETVDTDLDQDLRSVRSRARRLGVRRRAAMATFGTLAVVALVLAGPWILRSVRSVLPNRPATPAPAPTSPTPQGAVPNPFTIIGRFDPRSLGLHHPLGLAVGPDGNLYVTDSSQTVTVVSPGGKVLRRWGKPGTGPGEFRMTFGSIAVGPDGRVFVSDTGNFRVQVFSPTGAFLREFGSFGTGRGDLVWPFDIAVDDEGNAYVADDKAETVTRFSPSGAFVWRIGGRSSAEPDFVGHHHFAGVDAQGRIVMANDDLGRIIYVDRDGREVEAFGSGRSAASPFGTFPSSGEFPDGACDVTTDGAGDTVVNSCADPTSPTHNTEIFDPSHRLVGAWYGSPFAVSPRFGPNGEMFVLGYNGDILKLAIAPPRG